MELEIDLGSPIDPDTKAIKELAGAMKDLAYVIRSVNNIPTDAEIAARDLALKRYELEKAKVNKNREGKALKKKDLNNVRYIKNIINQIHEQINEYENLAMSITASINSEPVQSGTISDKIGNNACIAADLSKKLKEKEDSLIIEQMRLLDMITELDDVLLQNILIERCVNTKSWIQVANSIGGNTPESCKQMYYRFTKKL